MKTPFVIAAALLSASVVEATAVETATVEPPAIEATAPRLAGRYTGLLEMICQAKIAGTAVASSGDLEQALVTFTFTGSNFTIVGANHWGPLATKTKFITQERIDAASTLTISGTRNPYTVTMMGTTVLAHLDRIGTDGIARRATFLMLSSNGELPGKNCSQTITLTHD